MTEHGCRIAPRPPDAALSPVDVAFAGIEDRAREVCRENDRLRVQVRALEQEAAHGAESARQWRTECLLAERRFRRLIWIAGAVIAVLAAALARRLM